MEILYAFKLRETDFAQAPPNAVCPFKYLPVSEELAPLSNRKTKDTSREKALYITDINQSEFNNWTSSMKAKIKRKKSIA